MSQETRQIMSPKLLLLDVIGVALSGIGLAKQLSNVDVIPHQLRFDNYGIVFIVMGFALMIPAMLRIVQTAHDNEKP